MQETVFQPECLDFEKSPYTGMTRESWIAAAKFFLSGIFRHIKSPSDPVIVPRTETKITYPNASTPAWKKQAEIFEGLARSFFAAAPLIHIEPELCINGICLRSYYREQVLRACTKGDANYVLSYADMQAMEPETDPFRAYQQTVETSAVVICLWMSREEIWETYSSAEKDRIADFLRGFAEGNTVPQNWRLFNMLDLAFLNMMGYPIDRGLMREHAAAILSFYAGDGWYRDGQTFDYYSCWAFQVYAPIWNLWYGYAHEPYLAQKFEEHSNALMQTYAQMFDRDGFTTMWGRSGIYRCAAVCAMEGNLLLRHPTIAPGLARRIYSGSLLQFFTRDDFCKDGVPQLGFYGQFLPLVQSYSCAESPFWMSKIFLCLHLSKDHPFWTEREQNGVWEEICGEERAEGRFLKAPKTRETVLDGPGICITDHGANGAVSLRTAKVTKACDDVHGMWNYCKLVYHSKFPWDSGVQHEKSAGTAGGQIKAAECMEPAVIESQQYVLHDLSFDRWRRANAVFYCGARGGVLYRRQIFAYDSAAESHWRTALDLADFAVPYGLIRADRVRFHQRPAELILGAFGFPDNGTEIEKRCEGRASAVILRGHDHMGREKQLAMTVWDGWDRLDTAESRGNPDSPNAILIYARRRSGAQYAYEPHVLISQVITKESLALFSEEELFPIARIAYADAENCGGYGPVHIFLKDGTERIIDYDEIEGKMEV